MARVVGFWKKVGDTIQPVFSSGVNLLIRGTDKYLNFNEGTGESGYGFRDNAGTIEYKSSGGAWAAVGSGGGGGGTVDTIVAGTGITVDATDPANPIVSASGGAGLGDVVGPASAVDNRIAAFDGVTGKLIQDGGSTIANVLDRANHTGTQAASTISDFDTEVANNSAVAANTAKVTNATHTGDVTGATALTIANDVVTNAKLANVATNTIKGRVTAATGDPEDLTATQVRTLLNVEDGAEVNNISDANATDLTDGGDSTLHFHSADRNRANHTGTQAASTISDFDTEVSNNTDVAANTAARHAAVTVTDSAEINFTLTGQDITAALVAGSIDETKLDTSVNASLDRADSAQQPPSEGAFVNGDKTKLDGIETGADVTDAANVTAAGALMDSEVTNLAQVKAFDSADYATAAQGTLADNAIPSSQKGANNGVAELDAGGKVPSSQLPSFVDDVIEVANFAALPGTGETGKIYVTLDTNLAYRWSGSAYVEISASLALGETSSTAYRGDRGATAFAHTSLTNNPHGVTKAQVGLSNVPNIDFTSAVNANTAKISFDSASSSKLDGIEAGAQVNTVTSVADKTGAVTLVKADVGLGNVDNTSDVNKPVSSAQQTALDGKANTSHTHTASQVTDFDTAVAANSAVAANTAKVTNATHTGDVTGATALTIANNAVTNAKAADMAVNTIKGRITSGTGDPQDLTAANVRTITATETTTQLNTRDTNNRNRANHTGSQAISTVTGLQTELDTKLAAPDNVMGTVVHGATAGTARPSGFLSVTWVGSVEPTNATNNDIWYDTSA